MSKDQCVVVKSEGNKVAYCAVTVDDCFFAMTKDEDWINQSIDMLKAAFDELTVERGEVFNILGMTMTVDRAMGKAVINQKRFLDKLTSTFGLSKSAVTPATGDLIYGGAPPRPRLFFRTPFGPQFESNQQDLESNQQAHLHERRLHSLQEGALPRGRLYRKLRDKYSSLKKEAGKFMESGNKSKFDGELSKIISTLSRIIDEENTNENERNKKRRLKLWRRILLKKPETASLVESS